MSVIITNDQFKQMTSYKSYVENGEQHQKVKLSLVKVIKKSYGDKWYSLKDGTRKAIDYLAWFAAEKGFAFPGSDHVGEKYSISDRTVRNITKKLEEEGLIIKIYRRAKKTNSKGKPIFVFTNHPYFSYWTNFLNINCHADFREENNENHCGSKVEDEKKDSTTNLTYLNNNNNKRNDGTDLTALDDSFVPSHIPEEFIKITRIFFSSAYAIYKLWGRVKIAYTNSGLEKPIESVSTIIIKALKESIFSKKAGKIKGEFYGYFYGTLHRMFVVERRKEALNYTYNWLET